MLNYVMYVVFSLYVRISELLANVVLCSILYGIVKLTIVIVAFSVAFCTASAPSQ